MLQEILIQVEHEEYQVEFVLPVSSSTLCIETGFHSLQGLPENIELKL